jgi:hypothetical protein
MEAELTLEVLCCKKAAEELLLVAKLFAEQLVDSGHRVTAAVIEMSVDLL